MRVVAINNKEWIEITENDYDLKISYEKIRKETGFKGSFKNKSKIKIRGNHYLIIGGLSGFCYLKEL